MQSCDDYLFSGARLYDAIDVNNAKIERKIKAIPETQFLNTSDEVIKEHLISDLELEPIILYEDQKVMEQQETHVDVTGRFEYDTFPGEGRKMVPGIRVVISIPFTGEASLWKLTPNSSRSDCSVGTIHEAMGNGIGHLDIVLQQTSQTPGEAFKRDLDSMLDNIRFNLENQKKQIEAANKQLPEKIQQAITQRRERLGKHANIIEALNIPMKKKPGAPDMTAIPVRRKLVRPLPPAPNKPAEPGIRNEDYEHVLSVIRHEGCSFEATPATFAVHNEEELRDIILAHLNGHYLGDASGETFRAAGKTDIRIEAENRAAFVGECKVWHGPNKLLEAVDQLLGYLTWRDCKAAIVLFNKDVAGFSGIQVKIPETLAAHPNCLQQESIPEAGEWRFRFRSAEDEDRQVTVHVFLFNLFVGRQ